ncbi:hypothetical protein H4Q26_001804 [Puccinia striiformis f. sp. tritici PST-130]|nr:hypothetical protein H4Q26_001804 [Puccinia striiformis f. sp. tritici PST-130]
MVELWAGPVSSGLNDFGENKSCFDVFGIQMGEGTVRFLDDGAGESCARLKRLAADATLVDLQFRLSQAPTLGDRIHPAIIMSGVGAEAGKSTINSVSELPFRYARPGIKINSRGWAASEAHRLYCNLQDKVILTLNFKEEVVIPLDDGGESDSEVSDDEANTSTHPPEIGLP